ncbi:MAG: hypothetical protein AMXMBFR81_29450 [Chthonomonas sp.]
MGAATGWAILGASALALGQSVEALARYQRQVSLMTESWNRLQFDRYNTPALAGRAWQPMGEAIADYVQGYPSWTGRNPQFRAAITSLLRSAMPPLAGDPARDIRATEVWQVEGSTPTLIVSVTATYLVGPEARRFPRTSRASFVVWRSGRVARAQWLPEVNPNTGWFYGQAAAMQDRLVLVGGFAQKGGSQPGFIVYRLSGGRWSQVQTRAFGGTGTTTFTRSGSAITGLRVEKVRKRGDTFAFFGDQKLSWSSNWAWNGSAYRLTGQTQAATEYRVAEAFCEALQRGDSRAAAGYATGAVVVSSALEVGLGDPYAMWFAVPSGPTASGEWVWIRFTGMNLQTRVRARFARVGGVPKLAAIERR